MEGGAIDWDFSDASAASDGAPAPSINWDVTDGEMTNIEVVDAAEVGIGEYNDNSVDKCARQKERETILSSNETRRTLISELLELEVTFLHFHPFFIYGFHEYSEPFAL